MLLHGVKLDFSDMRFGVFGFLQYEEVYQRECWINLSEIFVNNKMSSRRKMF